MKPGIIVSALLVLLLSMGITNKAGAVPGRYGNKWGWGVRPYHAFFTDGHNWRYRGNRIGVGARPGHFYRPWSVKRREFHNSGDHFSHRYYN